jgi:hypothetical protein
MESEITFSLEKLIYLVSLVFSFGGGYAWLKFTTRNNTEKSQEQKEQIKVLKNDVAELERKCNLMLEKEKAFEAFVSKSLFELEKEHLNQTMDEIKNQNNTIINILTNKGVNK